MPLLPEKLGSRGEVRGAIGSQFWDQSVQSPVSINGLVCTLPCEPPPLLMSAASGLTRSQQMVAAQALDIPFTPSFVADEGGVVLDRVYARVGGKQWWANVNGRARLQRMLKQHREGAGGKEVFQDLNNFGLCTRTRHRFGRNTTLNTCLEAPSVQTAFNALEGRIKRKRPGLFRRAHAASTEAAASDSAAGDSLASTSVQGFRETTAQDERPAEIPEQQSASYSAQEASSSAAAAASHSQAGETASMGTAGSLRGSSAQTSRPTRDAARFLSGPPLKGRAWLKHEIAGHDLVGSIAWNEQALDSAAAYCRVPMSSSVDLASQTRQDGIQYRVGVHQVTANPTEGQHGGPKPARSSLHFQGAVAVEGEALLWKPSTSNSLWDSRRMPNLPDVPPALTRSSNFEYESSPAGPVQGTAAAKAKAKPTVAQGQSAPSAAAIRETPAGSTAVESKQAEGFSIPIEWNISIDDEGHATVDNRQGRMTGSAGGEQGAAASLGAVLPGVKRKEGRPEDGKIRGGGGKAGEEAEKAIEAIRDAKKLLGEGPRFREVDASAINSGLRKASDRLAGADKGIKKLTRELEHGGLHRRLNGAEMPRGGHRRSPYSPWLAQPYLKVIAAVGCLARIPLPQGALRPIRVKRSGNRPAGTGQRATPPPQPLTGRPGSGGLARLRTLSMNTRNAAERLPRFGRELWEPYLADTLLRVFASCGISGQIGTFTRPFLDFTQASVRLDLGLTSPQAQWLAKGGSGLSSGNLQGITEDPADAGGSASFPDSPYKHRAFALEGRGIWHALSLSATQQVYGPLRARADMRVALESPPPAVPPEEAGRATLEGAWQAIRTLRATQLESIFGLDCVVPNSQGAARIAAWWSPSRKEAMMELRLF
ncbi:hypothetical protein CVIRNUC_008062 [Coccomyxa viridis]|uniref:Uncharacterized protein n=1 Tax=Coccomyxa viridis TaxID=1274662 RepID=A0AAV1IFA7_9CHLO|nr:hypothetical protein CVIRNUC_008062 [Coccomyxa viridis]